MMIWHSMTLKIFKKCFCFISYVYSLLNVLRFGHTFFTIEWLLTNVLSIFPLLFNLSD